MGVPQKAKKSRSTTLSHPSGDSTIVSEIISVPNFYAQNLVLTPKTCDILMYERLQCSLIRDALVVSTFDNCWGALAHGFPSS